MIPCSRRTVLVVVSSVDTAVWLMDALPLLAADRRIVTFFTVAPGNDGEICGDAENFLLARGCPTLPWCDALSSEFDLVLAASPVGLAHLDGRLLLLPHGGDVRALTREVGPVTVVAADLCYDRLLASIPFRAGYRRAFGLSREQRLVVVTWAGMSTMDFLDQLLATLPPERYRVAVPVPAEMCGWQVRMWLADHLRAGLLLLQPEGWRAALVAADLVVGGCGAARYGAALGLPVMVAASADQMEAAVRAGRAAEVEPVTARAGYAGDILRRAMYGLLGIAEPERPVPCLPVPLPSFVHDDTAW